MAMGEITQWLGRHKGLGWVLLAVLVALFWLWRGELYQAAGEAPAAEPGVGPSAAEWRLEVTELVAEPYRPRLRLQGQLQPWRRLEVRARITGTVTRLPELGQRVAEGEALLGISPDDRQARLARAEADLALRQAELTAAERLRRNNLTAETDYLARRAALTQAEAALAAIRLELEHSRVPAPFAGSVDRLPLELGDVVQPGDSLLTLVDTAYLTLQADVPQQQVAGLAPGLPVSAVLLDGRELSGELGFVAQAADAATRSYALEARLANPDGWRVAGASAGLDIRLPEQRAHRLSPALLSLDEDGRPGVRVVDEDQRLRFLPVRLFSITPDTAWVGGLPERVRVVTRGGGFAELGERVAVAEREAAP